MNRVLLIFLLGLVVHTDVSFQQEITGNPCDEGGQMINATLVSMGTITSPNYPNPHPNGALCIWNITSPENTHIAIKFETLFVIEETEDGERCYDYISYNDGRNTRYACGNQPMDTFVTDSNTLLFSFSSDFYVVFAGFSLNWTIVSTENVTRDNITFSGNNGTILSPNYPGSYDNLVNIFWTINVPEDKIILLKIEELDMEYSSTCFYDSLKISDEKNVYETLCGKLKNKELLFHSSILYLSFKSDVSEIGAGFLIHFEAFEDRTMCSTTQNYTGTAGTVSSPNYPLAYPSGFACTWHITTPENTFIAIQFNTLFEVGKNKVSCDISSDFLQINDGPSEIYPQYQGPFCGSSAPRGFRSSSNMLTVSFYAQTLTYDGSVGFSFNWTAEDACPSDQFNCWDGTCLNETLKCNGIVDCPDDNADETSCSRSSGSCGITEIAPEFKWDYRIIGGHEAVPGSWPWQGYFATERQWNRGNGEYICSATLISLKWALTAAHCILKGPELRVVMGVHYRTEFDATTQQISTVDGIFAPTEYNFESNVGFFDGYDIALLHVSTPFNITKWVKPICLPDSTPEAGETIIITGWGETSFYANFPSQVLNQVRARIYSSTQCRKFDAALPDGVFCAGVDIGAASGCTGDSGGPVVYLRNGTWEVAGIVSFARQCGTVGIPSVYTDVSTYSSFVNNLIDKGPPIPVLDMRVINNASSGRIHSPNYGDSSNPNYPQYTYIRWYITAPDNKRITVRFEDAFSIEWSQYVPEPCLFDYLVIYDGGTTSSTKYRNQRMCSSTAPPDFESNSNAIIVEFWSDGSVEKIGFSFNYTIRDDCQPDEYRCWDGQCIPSKEQCDGVKNCESNEDEFECSLLDRPTSNECGKPYIAPSFPWSPLIIGGHHAEVGSWPWMVGLYEFYLSEWYQVCGGSIIDEYFVLTAAHCILESSRYQVALGDHNSLTISEREIRINVSYVIIHPRYNQRGDDMAILRLEKPIDFSTQWVKPVCLLEIVDGNPTPGTTCIAAGWGDGISEDNTFGSTILQQTPTKILNDSICDQEEIGFTGTLGGFICGGHRNLRSSTCYGDSGGPLVCLIDGTWRQYGIVSFGYGCAARTHFERVSKHIDIINEVISSDFCSEYQVQEGSKGQVTIPTINGIYQKNLECTWLLRGPENTVLLINFEKFDVQDCYFDQYFDYLAVYDGNSTSSRMHLDQIFCGLSRTIKPFLSSTNEVLITFVSNEQYQFSGFRLAWEAVEKCNSDEFRCWDGSCLNSSLRCNGINECPQGRDEIECPHPSETCGKQIVAPDLSREARIVGGRHAPEGAWPWQGYLLEDGNFLCGATIIDKKWMMTSAECVYEKNPKNISIVVGQTDIYSLNNETTLAVEDIFVHKNYNGFRKDYDIALIKLKEEIVYTDYIQPACIVTSNDTAGDRLTTGEYCVITGWGQTHKSGLQPSTSLRQTRVPIIDQDVCKKISSSPNDFSRDRMFCSGNLELGGVDACRGDSGGPLVCFRNNVWRQFGIVTHLLGCGSPGSPSYYTKVSYYGQWIVDFIPNITSSTTTTLPTPPISPTALISTISDALISTISDDTTDSTQPQESTASNSTVAGTITDPVTDTVEDTTPVTTTSSVGKKTQEIFLVVFIAFIAHFIYNLP